MKAEEPHPGNNGLEIDLLLEAIYRKYHYDFRRYSRASLERRLEQACIKFGCKTLSELQNRTLHEPEVFSALLNHLTIQVTDLFRDPSYYRSLREAVVPFLKTYPFLKVWVAGCSTGEEAYSLAILLREEGLLERTTIYATDINVEALKKAEAGVYNIERVPGFSRNYLEAGGTGSLADYYTAAYGGAILDKSLRRNMVFADHSLATDQVFAEAQLVSCRNVLIYFDKELQSRALQLFNEALCHKGFLGLGSKESLRFTGCEQQFETVVRQDRIFRKN